MRTALLLLLCAGCAKKESDRRPWETPKFYKALAIMESKGDTHAVGDSGRAVGLFQLWKIYVDDCNRIIGRQKWAYADRTNPEKSWAMVKLYLGYYCRAGRLGHEPTVVDACRIHNGGPNGYRKAATRVYAEKFSAIYSRS